MVRISKQSERRQKSPRKHKKPSVKTGPRSEHLAKGFKEHKNAIEGDLGQQVFIPQIK